MEFWNYIVEKALVFIPVLVSLGMFLKQIPKFPDWAIPITLLFCGIVLSGLTVGWTVDGFVQGVLVASAAVFGNQLVKQTQKAINGDK